MLGRPEVRLIHQQCTVCGQADSLQAYHQQVPPGGNYAYDVIVEVGLARFRDQRQDAEIQSDLAGRWGLSLPVSSIGSLAHCFLDGLAAVHQTYAPTLRERMAQDGGYALHVDGTCDRASVWCDQAGSAPKSRNEETYPSGAGNASRDTLGLQLSGSRIRKLGIRGKPRESVIGNRKTLASSSSDSQATPQADNRPSHANHKEAASQSRVARKPQTNRYENRGDDHQNYPRRLIDSPNHRDSAVIELGSVGRCFLARRGNTVVRGQAAWWRCVQGRRIVWS